MYIFLQFMTFTVISSAFLTAVSKAEPEPEASVSTRATRATRAGYGYNPPSVPYNPYLPPSRESQSAASIPGCNQCRPSERCTTELDVRDETVPKQVQIPTLDYQIRYESKPVHVVTDFDVRENPCPIVLPLQDKETRTEPRIREVEKIVKVRVPRIRENVVVKRIDRIKIVPIVQRKSKPVHVQHVRQVQAPYIVQVPKTVVQKKYTPEVVELPVPVRIANIVDVTVNRIEKTVEVPSIQFNYCEKIQEIQVKANCPTTAPPVRIPTAATPRPTYLPPGGGDENEPRYSVRNSYSRKRRAHNVSSSFESLRVVE